jgi:Hemerythrin HHE cation binding domain
MTARSLPGSEAARHGTGEADLTIMLAAHEAFRRDLVRLARAAAAAAAGNEARSDATPPGALLAGWETFKRQLHLHHTAEDTVIWPVLRERLAHSEYAQSVLEAMEAEHATIDPLLGAVDDAFGEPGRTGRVAEATEALTVALTGHLAHEERDGLPLIGVGMSAPEWRAVGFKIARQAGPSKAGEMFAWLADGAAPDATTAVIGTLPGPARLIYRAIWRPRYRRTQRW